MVVSSALKWQSALVLQGNRAIVQDCIFVNNTSKNNGGAVRQTETDVDFVGCRFLQNLSEKVSSFLSVLPSLLYSRSQFKVAIRLPLYIATWCCLPGQGGWEQSRYIVHRLYFSRKCRHGKCPYYWTNCHGDPQFLPLTRQWRVERWQYRQLWIHFRRVRHWRWCFHILRFE